MSDDYATPSFRKSKRDKKAKGRYNKFKKGGTHRAQNVTYSNEKKEKC